MKLVKIEALLMDNDEIMFAGRSLGFVKKDEMQFVETIQDYDS